MKSCPNCDSEVNSTSKFCPECGADLSSKKADGAWSAGMQEEIKEAGSNSIWMMLPFLVGAAVLIFALIFRDSLTSAGTLIFVSVGLISMIGSAATGSYYSSKKTKLIRQLKEGKRNLK